MASLLLLREGAPYLAFILQSETRVGRGGDCEVQILDPRLSRVHAVLRSADDGWWLEDPGSRNGTWVRGARVEAPVRLAAGDALRFGDTEAVFDPPISLLHGGLDDHRLCVVEGDAPAVAEVADAEPLDLDRDALIWLQEFTVALLGQLELTTLLQTLLAALVERAGADRGFVLLRSDLQAELRLAAVVGPDEMLGTSRSLLRRVERERRPLLVRDAVEGVTFVDTRSVVSRGIRSALVVPLLGGERLLGLVQIDARRGDAFDERRLSQLVRAAAIAAQAIENAQRRDRERSPAAAGVLSEATDGLVGASPAMQRVLALADRTAATNATVLVTGETGTGKELLASRIHGRSQRASGPLIAVNCAALPEELVDSALFGHEKGAFTGAISRHRGTFEQADGGTLFLDEVGDLAPGTQVRLLRVLQEGRLRRVGGEHPVPLDVRVVAATNRPIEALVREGRFREDLYYRLNVVRLEVPPLRQRVGDLRPLVQHLLGQLAAELGRPAPRVDERAMDLMEGYRWPGNVRELRNVLERAVVLGVGPVIGPEDLPVDLRAEEAERARDMAGGTLKEVLAETERALVARTLAETKGNKSEASRRLGITRPTLDRMIQRHGLAE